MTQSFSRLSDARVAPLIDAYDLALAARRRMSLIGLMLFLGAVFVSALVAEVRPGVLLDNIGKFTSYIVRIFHLDDGRPVVLDIAEWFWGLGKWLSKIGDTLLIAYLGTLLGVLGGFFLCFSAAANLARSPARCFLARRILEFCRTVPELAFALMFVIAFGLGPVPSVLGIAIHTLGALGKLFAEVVENIDLGPGEGAIASGASRWQAIRYAVVPQVLPNFASYALLRFEINVRSASIMGFVGAGGIGESLIESIRKFYYSDVSAILVLIILTVMLIDLGTERIRRRLLAGERAR